MTRITSRKILPLSFLLYPTDATRRLSFFAFSFLLSFSLVRFLWTKLVRFVSHASAVNIDEPSLASTPQFVRYSSIRVSPYCVSYRVKFD